MNQYYTHTRTQTKAFSTWAVFHVYHGERSNMTGYNKLILISFSHSPLLSDTVKEEASFTNNDHSIGVRSRWRRRGGNQGRCSCCFRSGDHVKLHNCTAEPERFQIRQPPWSSTIVNRTRTISTRVVLLEMLPSSLPKPLC